MPTQSRSTTAPSRRPSLRSLALVAKAAAGAVALAALGLGSAPALADPVDAPAQYCWTDVDTGAVQCVDGGFDEMAEQIEETTGGPLVAVPSGESARAVAAPLATYLLAVVYDQTGFNGSAMSYVTMNSAICSSTYGFPSLGAWNDRIDSFESFNGCATVLYRDASYGTPSYGPFTSSTDVGSMRHSASSLVIG